MYESFYGLKEKPFTLLPDPDYLYLSPKHQRALTLLEYGMMNQAGFSVICGDTGAGKTTLIRRLLSELGDDTCVGLITNTHQSFGELLNWVLLAFGLDSEDKTKAQMHQMFVEFLIEKYAQNKHTVLIVDEAQNMDADTLEELRMLSNINADKDQVLQVILAGQPALRETLRKPELMQFAQRIAVDYYLESLSEEETCGYIHHRLQVAGTEELIFTDEACKAIYKYSDGTPRLINLLCDTSLVYGFAEQSHVINEQLVHDVVREQHSNSIIPTFNTSQPHATDSISAPPQAEIQKVVEPVTDQKSEIQAEANQVEQEAVEETFNVVEKPDESVKQDDKIVAELAHNGTQASGASSEQAASVVNGQSTVSVTPTKLEIESEETAVDASNVTPIKTKQPEIEINEDDTKLEGSSTDTTVVPDEAGSDQSTSSEPEPVQQNSTGPAADHAAPYQTKHSENEEDVYPIVHIEENPKKGFNMMLMGLMGGMFIASVIMLAVTWSMFNSKETNVVMPAQQITDQELQRKAERRELEALQKERDAALAVSRALERERDAALKAAKAQEEIRAAELRATEILASQERKAEERLEKARARVREAERAESIARARERKLRLEAEKREIELETKRLQNLKEERQLLKALTAKEAAEEAALEAEVKALVEEKPMTIMNETTEISNNEKEAVVTEPKPEVTESFSTNPCNSPSAKFLSTCKK